MFFPGCSFNLAIAWGTSPSSSVAFQESGSLSVVEATYFGILLIRSMTPSAPGSSSAAVLVGQTSAKT
jgi:hypothetical protein